MKKFDLEIEIGLLSAHPYEVSYTSNCLSLGFAFDTQAGEHAISSNNITPFVRRPNSISLVPKGCDVYSASETGGEYLLIQFQNHDWINGDKFDNDRIYNNHVIASVIPDAHAIRKLLLKEGSLDELEVESYLHNMISSLITTSALKQNNQPKSKWLTLKRLFLIDEFIDDRIGENLTVSMLASEFGVSTGFFIRTFKLDNGQTPHRYIMDRRILKARRMLKCLNTEISEIAYCCGFSSQAHMTEAFKNKLAITPSKIRYKQNDSINL